MLSSDLGFLKKSQRSSQVQTIAHHIGDETKALVYRGFSFLILQKPTSLIESLYGPLYWQISSFFILHFFGRYRLDFPHT